MKYDVLVVGAGFAGSIIAERCASAGHKVLIIDKRPHLAGNAFDQPDQHGVLVHKYGPHIFHTNSSQVIEYLSRFTKWRLYEHRVLASVDGQLYPIPINRTTINRMYGLSLDEAGVANYLEQVREHREPVQTSEDVVLNSVGADLCDKFFRNYTRKQWNLDLSQLSPQVAARIPVRTDTDDRYFTDKYQQMPLAGYTSMFQSMLDHKNIEIQLNVAFQDVRKRAASKLTFYTGPIDEYFDFCFGALPYRSLTFEHEHFAGTKWAQPVATINYPNEHRYTRITEFKRMTGQVHSGTSIVREYPANEGDPYYPTPTVANQALYEQYQHLSEGLNDVVFVGRLARYKYYNMDQVVAAALKATDFIVNNTPRKRYR